MRCENKINMWILQIISQQMCFCLRVLRRTTGFLFLIGTLPKTHGNFFFSLERPSKPTRNFFSRWNDPQNLREFFFLVGTTLKTYENFFFSLERPSKPTGNFFFLVGTTLKTYGKFFFSLERPSKPTGNFFSRAKHPQNLREIFFLVQNTLE